MQKKVAFIIGSLNGGGAERVVSNLSLHLTDKIERYILIYNCEETGYPYKGRLVKLKPCKRGEIKGWFRKLYYLYKYMNEIRNIKSKYGIQVCVSFLSTSNLINILSGNNGKKIISVRGYTSKNVHGFYGRVYALLLKILYNTADVIVAVSQGVKEDLTENYDINAKKVAVIYNPYDIKKIQCSMSGELQERYKPIFENQVVICVGRLTYPKGQWHLIRAFSKVKKQCPDVKLVLLGRGELEDKLHQIAEDLNLNGDIHFLGFQENPFQFIRNSTVFVLPSLTEGFPNALVEAMACGIPVIATDCRAGPREILSPNSNYNKETTTIEYAPYGMLVPVCDGKDYGAGSPLTPQEDTLAESIIKLLMDRDLRDYYSLMAEQRANAFRIESVLPQWENLLLQN